MSANTRKAIYGKMAGDSTLTTMLGTPGSGYAQAIYYQHAPSDAAFPYVIFNQQAGTPTDSLKTPGALVDEVWMIKGVDRSDSADGADGIADRLLALLNDATLSISGVTGIYLRRESDLPSYSEINDGIRYIHAGALFRLTYT